jgi:copper(I)-binding protein
MKVRKYILSIMFVFAMVSLSYAGDEIEVKDAWVREVPPASTVTAAYLNIENKGDKADKLTGVSSDIAGKAQIHKTSVDDKGVAKMEMQKDIEIPAGETVVLEPGGTHIMLIDLKEPVMGKDEVELDLTFENAGEVEVEAHVMGLGDGNGGHDHH